MFLSFYNVRFSTALKLKRINILVAKNPKLCIKRTPAYPMVKHIIY